MKKIFALALIATAGAALTGCNDFLDDNRYPLTKIISNPQYWGNPANVQLQVDRYQDELQPGYGSGGSGGWSYFKTLSDDQVGSSFANWAYPDETSQVGEYDYSIIRGANIILDGIASAQPQLSKADHLNYEGIAKLIRAYEYYKLVRMFGDVCWFSHQVDPGDPEALYADRTNRDIVMDSVFQDINFAIAAIATESSKLAWSKDLARAIKSEVCLYEGTFCRYRTVAENGIAPNEDRAKKFLQECATVSYELINKYGFNADSYQAIYNSTWSGDANAGVTSLSDNPELIFGRRYDKDKTRHSTISYTASSTTTSGMSLDAFRTFLFSDGLPEALTSCNTTLVGVPDADAETLCIQNLLDVRDARLSVITDPYVYYKGMEWDRAGCTQLSTSSGFGIAKFDNVNLPVADRTNSSYNYTSAPIFWNSYIMLNYAEAKAELGTLTDGDLNLTINKLFTRANLPTRTVAQLSAINDPANNHGVSSLLWEIRRCRRCELMFDNWIRYWDLVRWHQLDKLDSTRYPDVLRGAYVANAPKAPSASAVDAEGFVRANSSDRIFDKKYYLYPIPTEQIRLYLEGGKTLNKNFGW